jgi:hypothetical protein
MLSNAPESFEFGEQFVDVLDLDAGLTNRWLFHRQSLDTRTDVYSEIGRGLLLDRLFFRFLQI